MEGFLCLTYYTRPCESESPDTRARAGVSPVQRPAQAEANVEIQGQTQVEVRTPHLPCGQTWYPHFPGLPVLGYLRKWP